jgi:SSS family transporter
MLKKLPLFLLTTLTLAGICSGTEDAPPDQGEYFTLSEPASVACEGQAAGRAYASVGSTLFAIGGKAPDGTLLSSIQILEKAEDTYLLKHAELKEPVAFAGATGHGGAIYLAGGLTDEGATKHVWKLEWKDGNLKQTALPSLPEALVLPGITKHHTTTKDFLYVLSGLPSADAAELSAAMYELPITDYKEGISTWQRKDDLPFGGRLGAVVCETYNEIVVSGGWRLEDGQLVLDPQTWGYARIARDGHADPGWEQRADQPSPVATPAFSKTGQSHLIVAGGDSSGGSLASLLNGTKPVTPVATVWSFHDPTDTWHPIGELQMACSQGGLVADGKTDYLLTGTVGADGEAVAAAKLSFTHSTRPMGIIDWSIIIVYFAVVACVGFMFAKKQTSSEEFALGNRQTKWWAAAISLFASGVSTISFMALPALFACVGLVQLGGTFFIIPGVFVAAFLTYPILRRLNITSTYEYLEMRYGIILRLVGSFVGIMVQLMGRIGIVVMLPALAISAMTGLDPMIAILLTGIITTLYSAAGGFEAVIWTDVTQGFLMMAGFIALGVLAFMNIEGGFPVLKEYGISMDRFNLFIFRWDLTINMIWFAVIAQIFGIMAFASDQATAQRVLSIPMKDVRKMAFMFGGYAFGVAVVVAFVGISLFGFFKSQPEFLNPVMKNDQMVPIFILNKVPVGLSGLLIATMFAAAMSTVSTSVNSCAVMFAEDFYKRFRKTASSKEEMRVMQIVTVVSGLFGTGLAMWLLTRPMPTLWESFQRIMAMIAGGLGGVYTLGMFTRRAHEWGAICGVVASFFSAWFVQQLPFDVHYMGLGIINTVTCISVGYLSSLIIPCKPKPLRALTVWDQISNEEAEARIREIEGKEG